MCCYSSHWSSGLVTQLLSANQPLNFMLYYKDIAVFSWGEMRSSYQLIEEGNVTE